MARLLRFPSEINEAVKGIEPSLVPVNRMKLVCAFHHWKSVNALNAKRLLSPSADVSIKKSFCNLETALAQRNSTG